MTKERRRLELCRKGGRFWLLIRDGRQFSGSKPTVLVEAVRALATDDPLAVHATDDIIVRRPMADFAPVMEALRPGVELIAQLD